jgi:hypothetical protein
VIRGALVLFPAALLGACAAVPAPHGLADACAADAPLAAARIDPGEVVRRDITMAAMREDAVRVLAAAAPDGLTAGSPRPRHYFGQSLTKTRLDARLTAEDVALADGGSCAVPQRMEVVLRFVQRELRVAEEAHGDLCLMREVETHERRHVALDDEMIESFRPVLEARVRAFADTLVPVAAGSFHEAKKRLSEQLLRHVRVLYDEFESLRHRRHHDEIDTPEEYARVRTMCDGRAHALVPRSL